MKKIIYICLFLFSTTVFSISREVLVDCRLGSERYSIYAFGLDEGIRNLSTKSSDRNSLLIELKKNHEKLKDADYYFLLELEKKALNSGRDFHDIVITRKIYQNLFDLVFIKVIENWNNNSLNNSRIYYQRILENECQIEMNK